MANPNKEQILKMKAQGVQYMDIASSFGLSVNTVRSVCRRAGLATARGTPDEQKLTTALTECIDFCRHCGKSLKHKQRGKPRLFCTDICRRTWWHEHGEQSAKKAVYSLVCDKCGRKFESYGNKGRKYCSHACYIQDRYGGEDNHDTRSV